MSGSTEVELVIFDLDGVLVDTQQAETDALAYLAALQGVQMSAGEADELFAGKRLAECIDEISRLAGAPAPTGAVELVRAKCEDLIGDAFVPIDGVREVLAALDTTVCVASNSPRELIRRRLSSAGLGQNFGERLYSAYDIRKWKPEPDLFTWAARDCGVAAGSCVVVEDSPVGVAAGIAAGMRVLQYVPGGAGTPGHAVSSGNARSGLPTVVPFTAMKDLPALIPRAGAGGFPVVIEEVEQNG